LLAGDAAGFEEPFSGEGIGQALRSGQAAGQAILTGGTKEAVQRNYVRLLGEHRRIRRRTRWLSTALRHPITRALLDSPLPIPAEVGQRILARVHIKGTA
jgi:flavin-dependent dehydrogenase